MREAVSAHNATLVPVRSADGRGPTMPRRRWRCAEDGFMMIEVLVAALVLTIGIIGLIGAFDSSRKLTLLSERRTSLAHRGQQEIERLLAVPYSELAMNPTPTHSAETTNPDYYVSASNYQWDPSSGSTEPLVTGPACESPPQEGCGGVSGTPAPWTDGRLSGYVYDFVTWHTDGHCGALCPAEKNYKRVTVVVTVTVPANTHSVAPFRLSAFVPDPAA